MLHLHLRAMTLAAFPDDLERQIFLPYLLTNSNGNWSGVHMGGDILK